MKKALLLFTLLYFCKVQAQIINITGPAGSGQFGKTVTVLTNGNYVVTDPLFDDGAVADVGAVYLYNGSTHALISTLKGSHAGDQAGSNGIFILNNGNYIVCSPGWHNAAAVNAGAVTWCNGTAAISGIISSSNSLVGSTTNDSIGGMGIAALNNGNYIVCNPYWDNGPAINAGAVTWGNGSTGVSGVINSGNSLTGSTTDDLLGTGGITVLANSNFVVISYAWDNGTIVDAGAVTWGNGATGITGPVNSSNSLTGSTAFDLTGSNGVTALNNGNYAVVSANWSNGVISRVGAVTWGNGTTGITGPVNSSNSLTGSTANDGVGGNGITVLNNGNYIVISQNWNNNTGAITWGNGTTGITGIVSSSNSLVGGTAGDNAGIGVIALTNGNYVVFSLLWNNEKGAVTWGNGTTGISGVINNSNSLTGSITGDNVGSGVIALTNGNYVALSSMWNNGTAVNAGAATWCNGTTGTTGTVNSSNSLVGSTAGDGVGGGATALSNGNYVIYSPYWSNGPATAAGAATWCNGTTGTTGTINSSNSLVGSKTDDYVAFNGVKALTNGNYIVVSSFWDNGAATNAGAITWGNGATGITGSVSSSNSLAGSTADDFAGSNEAGLEGITVLANGNYVVSSLRWDNGAAINAGAVTWGNGSLGVSGIISSANSLTGNISGDGVGTIVTGYSDGNYTVHSANWNNGLIPASGAVTWGNGNIGVAGNISNCNSITGTTAYTGSLLSAGYNKIHGCLVTGRPGDNTVSIYNASGITLAVNNDSATAAISGQVPAPLIPTTGCGGIIATITANGSNPVSGIVDAKVWIETSVPSYQNEPFVARHYQITPVTNASSATAKITLYFTQQEFNDFNDHPGSTLNLPADAGDAAGIANLRIGKYAGTSNNGSGLPETYTGPVELIDPDDADIVWNSSLDRWEISFAVTGFSGFIVQTKNAVLVPLKLLRFSASVSQNDAWLSWKTTNEMNTKTFEVERSTDGSSFKYIGTIAAISSPGDHNYNYTDTDAVILHSGRLFYRLKQIDNDGQYSYSPTVLLYLLKNNSIAVYPNPVYTVVTLHFDNSALLNTKAVLLDMQGKRMMELVLSRSQLQIDMSRMPAGMYILKLEDGTALKLIKN